ncbi:MAG: hypothetical protein ACTHMZ_06845 [Actinomycetes bacterium]
MELLSGRIPPARISPCGRATTPSRAMASGSRQFAVVAVADPFDPVVGELAAPDEAEREAAPGAADPDEAEPEAAPDVAEPAAEREVTEEPRDPPADDGEESGCVVRELAPLHDVRATISAVKASARRGFTA